MGKVKPSKIKMTQAEWEVYAREQFNFYRFHLNMEGEDIDITPESEGVEIVEKKQ